MHMETISTFLSIIIWIAFDEKGLSAEMRESFFMSAGCVICLFQGLMRIPLIIGIRRDEANANFPVSQDSRLKDVNEILSIRPRNTNRKAIEKSSVHLVFEALTESKHFPHRQHRNFFFCTSLLEMRRFGDIAEIKFNSADCLHNSLAIERFKRVMELLHLIKVDEGTLVDQAEHE